MGRFLPWVGAGVVAAGISAATIAVAGPAVADDGSAGGDTQSSSDSSGAKDNSGTRPDADPKPKDDATDPSGVDSNDGKDPDDGEHADPPRDNDRPANNKRPRLKTERDPVDNEDPATEDVTVTVDPAPAEAVQTSEPSKPNIVTTVSSVVTTLLNPFSASTTPDGPAAQPQLWTLAAAARRELETGAVSPSLAEDVAPVQNSLTYTPGPTFADRIALTVQEVFRVITKVTGVPVTAVLGRVLATGTPPFFLTFGLDTQRTVYTTEDGTQWQVWEFHPPNPTGKTVVAFHGGGWIYQPSILNWIDYTQMARNTGATVVVPLYPLATTPEGSATEVIPDAADFISHQIALNGAENVSLYADSAGTVIAISAVRELLRAGKPVPSSMVLLSMPADATLSNPDIRNVDDPLFDPDDLDVWDSHWYDGIADLRDPLISPLFLESEVFRALPPTTIYVGEREILYPDTLLLHQRAVDEGAPISVVVGTGLLHGWPSSGLPIYSQTAAVRPDIYRQLGLTSDAATLA